MASIIEGACGRDVYLDVVKHVLKTGVKRVPRDMVTYDAGFTVIQLASAVNAMPLDCGRNLNQAISAAEAVQLIGGFSAPGILLRISNRFRQFMNGDGFHGAYGSRIRMQIPSIVTKLQNDVNTRQAVATLWDPQLDNLSGMNDYPCTVALQFEIRDGRLCMNTIMRSNDVWLGLPYDMFQFTQLQLSVANALQLSTGWYRHTTLSLHIYERDIYNAECLYPPSDQRWQPDTGIGQFGDKFTTIMQRARAIGSHVSVQDKTASEEWYCERLEAFMGRDVDGGRS